MNPKLIKYTEERERNVRRIQALEERNVKLDRMIMEQQNIELTSLLQGAGMSYQDLTSYIRAQTGQDSQPLPMSAHMEEAEPENDVALDDEVELEDGI